MKKVFRIGKFKAVSRGGKYFELLKNGTIVGEIKADTEQVNLKENIFTSLELGQIKHLMWECKQNNKVMQPTEKYRYCNHHHELTVDHEIVDFGDGEFVANKVAIPLLKALNELGLRTRSHHITEAGNGWFTILLHDNVAFKVQEVNESSSTRNKYNGRKEILIAFGEAALMIK